MKNQFFYFLILLIWSNKILSEIKIPCDYKFIKPKLVRIPNPTFVALPSNSTTACINPLLKPLPFNALSTNNWCGYVASTNIFNPQKGTVTFVQGTWVIPTIAEFQNNTFYSIWVGIDGFNNGTIEQLGTAYQFINGKKRVYAWFEMFPKNSMAITNFPVNARDSITAAVQYQGNGKYKLTMANNTKKNFTVIPGHLTMNTVSPRTCVEWIVEAPASTATGKVLPLAHFNPVHFSGCKCTIKGITGSISNTHWQNARINMVSTNGVVKAVATALSPQSYAFTVNWKHN